MLEPYVRRVDFLKHLAKDNGLNVKAITLLSEYEDALVSFIQMWAGAKRRCDEFHSGLDRLTTALRDALNALGRLRKHRHDRLLQLNGSAASIKAAVDQSLSASDLAAERHTYLDTSEPTAEQVEEATLRSSSGTAEVGRLDAPSSRSDARDSAPSQA